MIITIDGPTASGKSTTARALAEQLGYYYLNSGKLYRALAYLLQQQGYDATRIAQVDEQEVRELLNPQRLIYRYQAGAEQIFFDGTDITNHLDSPQISDLASRLSVVPFVRNAVNALQHRLAEQHDVVADGRDVGSVVFPQAELKIFLTAPLEVRAKRWQKKQRGLGKELSFDQAVHDVGERDERDMTRAIAPLVVPEGAVVISNEDKTIDATVRDIVKLV